MWNCILYGDREYSRISGILFYSVLHTVPPSRAVVHNLLCHCRQNDKPSLSLWTVETSRRGILLAFYQAPSRSYAVAICISCDPVDYIWLLAIRFRQSSLQCHLHLLSILILHLPFSFSAPVFSGVRVSMAALNLSISLHILAHVHCLPPSAMYRPHSFVFISNISVYSPLQLKDSFS